ncbi:flagellar hook-basal body protein [Ruminococcaceae bacterium OttesenSCG-928-I18]|nr:flagellar hook-basal body protein [Ruminococcaceae bacterium OttesenSCG-928-I18]
MLQGFYTAASGMFMQQRSLNVISHNIGNLQTPGFKTSRLLSSTFEQNFLTRLERYNTNGVGTGDPARIVSEVPDIFTAGGLTETTRPFDMALTGYGFFNIQGEDGQTYLTRDGQFDLDDEGYLVLRGRGRVLGQGGPLQINTSDIAVDANGQITNSLTGAALGTLAITVPADDADVEQNANGLFSVAGGPGAPAEDPQLVQGAYENSNVNMTDEMTAMMMAQRNFSSASQALQFIDATYAKAVNIAAL